MEPISSQNSPYVVNEEPGTKAYCACGRSEGQPYCDGSHAGTGMAPTVVKLEEAKTVAWCGCRKSGTAPYCDGTHARG